MAGRFVLAAVFLAALTAHAAGSSSLTLPPNHPMADGFHYSQDCAKAGKWVRVEASPNLQRMYKAVSQALANQWLPIYSCIRGQEEQDKILAANHCAPRFGTVQCSGRIAANISEHTRGVAGDFFVRNFNGTPEQLCQLADRARSVANGGRGGITYYGTQVLPDPDSGQPTQLSGMHFDVGTDGGTPSDPAHGDWCNWGLCEKVLGEGHCKRTKFRLKVATLEEQVATAKLAGSQATVAQLEKQLSFLNADCKPGDLKCRDDYQ